MAKFSKKVMGKEVGDASVYAEPHDMKGRAGVDLSNNGYGKGTTKSCADKVNMSVGNINRDGYPEPKTSGIKTRGNGAAQRGVTARGPMA
jgi:hypothetical protein